MRDCWNLSATLVADEFIDQYMAGANGEYVKVYLYVLRHQKEKVDVRAIADALNHTESDVERALSYWKKVGVLFSEEETKKAPGPSGKKKEKAAAQKEKREEGSESYPAERVNGLVADEEFSQLLFMAQKYLDRVFTPRDCQVFAYLYDGLRMGTELLEYLVEYCVQNGHTSLRYLETVALNWHEKGFRTSDEAKAYTESFKGDAFRVMKAFGLGDRRPAAGEIEMIERWFKEYGFDRELVLLACERTISAIHTPSFQYADKILSDWKKAGVHTKREVEIQDQRRKEARKSSGSRTVQGESQVRSKTVNQFHNFSQRDTDYDALMLKQIRERVGQI